MNYHLKLLLEKYVLVIAQAGGLQVRYRMILT